MGKTNSPLLFEIDFIPSVLTSFTPGKPMSVDASIMTPLVWEKNTVE
jgi:hypothetical protein